MKSAALVLAVLLGLAAIAHAEPLGQISGRVLDRTYGTPVEGALVHVSKPDGTVKALRTNDKGRYAIFVASGNYRVLFAYGRSHTVGEVTVDPGASRLLDASIDAITGEVIVIHEQLPPKKLPKALNYPITKAPPYSDRAVLEDAWTRAWMLLDINAQGEVTRFKWLKRPGYNLEAIATAEVFKIKFSPAIDATGKPTRLYAVWKFEWTSMRWQTLIGTGPDANSLALAAIGAHGAGGNTRSKQPSARDIASVPCGGGGRGGTSWNLDSRYAGYRDCSLPDLKKASTEAWVTR